MEVPPITMSDQFTRELLNDLGPSIGEKLSAQNLLTSDQASDALSSLAPIVLGSLKRKQEGLDDSGFSALLDQAGADEGHLDQLDSVLDLGSPNPGNLDAVLDTNTQDETVMALSKKLGVGKGVMKQLLPMLVPVILGMLAKKGRQEGGDSRSSGIGGILDRNGNGTMIDDIAGMVLGQKKGGFLQMILSMIFGKR